MVVSLKKGAAIFITIECLLTACVNRNSPASAPPPGQTQVYVGEARAVGRPAAIHSDANLKYNDNLMLPTGLNAKSKTGYCPQMPDIKDKY